MRVFLRATLALLGVGAAVSTSQAFWRHRTACHRDEPPGAACPPAGVTYVPETRDVYTTRYRAEVRYVPETVVTRVTTMVPVQAPPPMRFSAPAGCMGTPPPSAGAGCHGSPPPSAGCMGTAPGANFYNVTAAPAGPYAQLDARLGRLEDKLTAATEALLARDRGANEKAAPAPPRPTPARAAVAAEPADPLLAAARAYKARQETAAAARAATDGGVSGK